MSFGLLIVLPATYSLSDLLVVAVVARQERREPVGGARVLGVGVDEGAEAVGQPRQADLLLAPPVLELLDPAVREVQR